jgi:hypothetical protein
MRDDLNLPHPRSQCSMLAGIATSAARFSLHSSAVVAVWSFCLALVDLFDNGVWNHEPGGKPFE